MQEQANSSLIYIVASNPKAQSLTVTAAKHCAAILTRNKRENIFVHLDSLCYDPLLTEQEIQRRISFDPVTLKFQQNLKKAALLALFFPDWYGFPPALLVGWLQRVLAPGLAFEYTGEEYEPKYKRGLLTNLKVLLAVSSDEDAAAPLDYTLALFRNRIFSYCGVEQILDAVLYNTHNSQYKQRKKWMHRCAELCLSLSDRAL